MSEYSWNKKNVTFTWLSSLYNPFNAASGKRRQFFVYAQKHICKCSVCYDLENEKEDLTLNYIWTCRLASAAGMKPKTIRISLRNIFWEKCPSKRSIKKISSVYIKQIYSNGYCYKCFQVAFKLQKE